jgi:hypothetical protein
MSPSAVPQLLTATARELVASLEGSMACVISRVIGDLLIELTQFSRSGAQLEPGHTYLVSDFPLTLEVIETGTPRIVSVADPAADAEEVALLRRLGFESLLMLVLKTRDEVWALVEIYGGEGGFGSVAVETATGLVAQTGSRLEQIQSA